MKKSHSTSFASFLEEPPIAMSILVIGLVALLLAVLEFSNAVTY